MKNFLLDIETVPKPEAELLKLMPESMANPVMPLHIANPEKPHFGKPPKYATKEHTAGDPAQQKEWLDKKEDKWKKDTEDAKSAWREKSMEAKARFIGDAALEAHLATIKVIGLWDTSSDIRNVVIVGAALQEQRRLQQGKYPCKVDFAYLPTEQDAMAMFVRFCKTNIRKREEGVEESPSNPLSPGRFVGYNIADFDLRMVFRKCMAENVTPPWRLRKGRYWQDELICDLREIYQLGDRQYSMGGLDGLARILGCKRKIGRGALFWKMWQEDPAEAMVYHLEEGTTIKECADKMGVL